MRARRKHAEGSALLTALLVASVLCIAAAGVVGYVESQFSFDWRSHQWNQALHLAEAGVDMAWAECNYQYAQGVGFTTARGWTNIASGTYRKTVTGLTDTTGRSIGDITATVSGISSNNPSILGVGTCALQGRGPTISRAVNAIMQSQQQSGFAFLCRSFLKLNGTTTSVDSYCSTDSTKSTGGMYDPAKRQANGNLGVLKSTGTFSVSASSGNGDVYGKFYTAPAGLVTMGAGASVGATFNTSLRAYNVADGEIKGWILHNLSTTLPDVILPSALSSLAASPDITSSKTLPSGDMRVVNITLSAGKTLNIAGDVRLYVTGKVSLSGSGQIVVNTNATLQMYLAGQLADSGQGVVNNNGRPATCHIYGLASATAAWTLSGSSAFYGAVYAPSTPITLSGGGSAFCGQLWCDSVTSSGSVIFHFDEDLLPKAACTILTWQEFRNESGAWVP